MRVRIALIAALSLVPEIALGACGSGYRGPDGQCVGRAALARVCGNPPAQKCRPERAQGPANDAADTKSYRERAMGY